MPADVTMPKLTDSMEEGRIVEWKVAVGDQVNEGDVLAEIETDKAVMELESFWIGAVVELIRGDGDVVAVGEIIARVGSEGEVADQPPPAVEGSDLPAVPQAEEVADEETEPAEPEVQPVVKAEVKTSPAAEPGVQEPDGQVPGDADRVTEEPAVPGSGGEIPIPGGHPLSERGGVASARPAPPVRPAGAPEKTGAATAPATGVRAAPRARRRALELGVDLSTVKPTGGDGQVTVEDVEAAPRGAGATSAPDATAEPAAAPPDRADEELPPVLFAPEEAEAEAVSFYQKAVIRRVVASKHVIPHFYVTKAVRADELLERQAEARDATGATLTHFIMQSCAKALQTYPEANRSYDRGSWIRWKVVHLGLAVQTDAGLVVAVLRDVHGRDLAWVAEHTRALVGRARDGKLSGPERTNPTFTISNLGAFDVESFSAIINPPSALTLAVGSVVDTPVLEGGKVIPGKVMHLTLSCDHRVVDGVLAARFLGEVKRLLESPEEL